MPTILPPCNSMRSAVAAQVVAATQSAGGVTIDPVLGTTPVTGYAVGIRPMLTRSIPVTALTMDAVLHFVTANNRELSRHGWYLGSWLDLYNLVHLDIVSVCTTATEALRLGRDAGQQAIYDLSTSHKIPVLSPVPPVVALVRCDSCFARLGGHVYRREHAQAIRGHAHHQRTRAVGAADRRRAGARPEVDACADPAESGYGSRRAESIRGSPRRRR
jgi:hypothetical protein